MKHVRVVAGVLGLALGVGVAAHAAAPAVARPKVKSVTFGIGNRVFTDFYDEVTTRMNEEFRVGDTEYTAKTTEFLPDFYMDMKTHRISSRSNEPRNPAFHIFVRKKGAPEDTTWAFLNMPPHFGRRSMLAFKILKVEFENRAPLEAKRDTSAAPKAQKP